MPLSLSRWKYNRSPYSLLKNHGQDQNDTRNVFQSWHLCRWHAYLHIYISKAEMHCWCASSTSYKMCYSKFEVIQFTVTAPDVTEMTTWCDSIEVPYDAVKISSPINSQPFDEHVTNVCRLSPYSGVVARTVACNVIGSRVNDVWIAVILCSIRSLVHPTRI
jgi:hypothetical protein